MKVLVAQEVQTPNNHEAQFGSELVLLRSGMQVPLDKT